MRFKPTVRQTPVAKRACAKATPDVCSADFPVYGYLLEPSQATRIFRSAEFIPLQRRLLLCRRLCTGVYPVREVKRTKVRAPLVAARAAFTLAEVLAALAFMAIVIPVAVEGLRIANLAGQVGQRKAAAVRVAERVLHESLLAGQSRGAAQTGVTQEGLQAYRWSLRSEPWTEDSMKLVTVQVLFPVQGRDYDVHLSTLVSSSSP